MDFAGLLVRAKQGDAGLFYVTCPRDGENLDIAIFDGNGDVQCPACGNTIHIDRARLSISLD